MNGIFKGKLPSCLLKNNDKHFYKAINMGVIHDDHLTYINSFNFSKNYDIGTIIITI